MDFSSISELARSQGPVFWVATVAIALGATLLVVALVQLLRRVLAAKRDVRIVMPDPVVQVVDNEPDTYKPTLPVTTPAPRAAAPAPAYEESGDYSLALMLRRLQSAGDRLEEIAGDLKVQNPLADDSGLKEDLQDVEYVFRASGP